MVLRNEVCSDTLGMPEVQVFVTDVSDADLAALLMEQLQHYYPKAMISFDLEDCDHVLRVEGEGIDPDLIFSILNKMGVDCRFME